VTELVLRAATAPATTTAPAWAVGLAVTAVGDFIASLAPLSAAARLFEVAPRATLDGRNLIQFPRRLGPIDPADVPWVVEAGPLPVLQFDISGSTTLGPTKKLAAIVVTTFETTVSGAGEAVTRTLLRENVALSLDTTLFSNVAATTARPAGALAGVTALTAATGGDDAAMNQDLTSLANAISVATAGLAFVMHPAQASAIKLRRGNTFPTDVPIWPTLGVAEGVVIALDPAAFVSAFGAEPEISASREAMIHMEADAPLQIASGPQGTGVLASPSRSLFQTDCVATRLLLDAAWAWRVPSAVAWMNVTW
jgi:hypothetical protein